MAINTRMSDLQGVIEFLAYSVREYLEGKGAGFGFVTTVLFTYYPDGTVTMDAHGDGAQKKR